MSTNESKLFSFVKYFTTGFRDSTIERQFKQHGATRLFYLTEKTTHVICDDFQSNKDELEQAIEIYQTPIITSDWIEACLKVNTLLPYDSYRSLQGNQPVDIDNKHEENNDSVYDRRLFQSCTFANANLINDDHKKVYALVTYYGGRWIANLDSLICTHIICASALPEKSKIDDANNNREHVDERLQDAYEIQSDRLHLVTPDWILDCLKEHQLLNETEYHPDLLQNFNELMDTDDLTVNRNDQIRSNDDCSTTTTTKVSVDVSGT
jgi:PAX-interacting protein 1